jgi:TonB family protein
MLAISDVAIVQSQSPLSNQPVAVALPPPQLRLGVIGDVQAGAAAGFTSSSTPARTTGSFGDAKVAERAIPAAASIRASEHAQSLPVEILSKPRPIYTEEARKLRIQGEVLLEVMFRAAGDVQVVRTVRGLGHGLDEAAEDAARHILFRPARRGESAVDAAAVVHIAFELAY